MGIFVGMEVNVKYIKKINNNVALATDDEGTEWVLLGKGLGFGRKRGDIVAESVIERRFRAEADTMTHQDPPAMLANIDPDILQLASDITQAAAKHLSITFSNYNYLALADHLAYAIKRSQTAADYPDDFRWDVQKLFPKEYRAAEAAIQMVKDQTEVQLPASELTFLTYHFVSAQNSRIQLEDTVEMTALINRILEIISYHFQTTLDSHSLNYARFLTHLRFFIIREMKGEQTTDELAPLVVQVVKEKYPKAHQAAAKIAAFLHQTRGWEISDTEQMYLTLHVWRLIRE